MQEPTPGQHDKEPPVNTEYFLENWKQADEENRRPKDEPWVDPTPKILPGVFAKLDFRQRKRKVIEVDPDTGKEVTSFGENMWVKVAAQQEDGNFVGTLANDPAYFDNLKFGDEVIFRAENVREIAPPEIVQDAE